MAAASHGLRKYSLGMGGATLDSLEVNVRTELLH